MTLLETINRILLYPLFNCGKSFLCLIPNSWVINNLDSLLVYISSRLVGVRQNRVSHSKFHINGCLMLWV